MGMLWIGHGRSSVGIIGTVAVIVFLLSPAAAAGQAAN